MLYAVALAVVWLPAGFLVSYLFGGAAQVGHGPSDPFIGTT
jgi:hypothetical protein